MKILMGVLMALGFLSSSAMAETVELPQPNKTGGIPLMEAIAARKTSRDFSNKEVDAQALSDILWVAYGVSHGDGLRTIPTAQNKKDLDVYVVKKDGAWLYDAEKNALIQITDKNHLSDFQAQDYMKDVPLVLVYTATIGADYGAMHAGSAYQNVGLYCASKGMKNVIRGYFDKKKTKEFLKLPKNKQAVITQAIGW